MDTTYIITGTRPTGEVLFLCNSYTQGLQMVPNSQSRAERFSSRQIASAAAYQVKQQWKGLHVAVEEITLPTDEELHRSAMQAAFGEHGQG